MRGLLLNRRLLGFVAIVGGLLAVAMWPGAIAVDMASASRGRLTVTIDEEGITRVRDRFVVSSPLTGRVLRIELEPGDAIRRGQPVARVRAEVPPLLDERARQEAQAAVESARAALGRAKADEQRARASLDQMQRELTRIRELANHRVVSPQELEAREADARVAEASLNAAVFSAQAAGADLQRAIARLNPATPEATGRVIVVNSPADGVVLKRLRESESLVPAGQPLLEIGDPRRLEIVADVLSTEAVRIVPGARAFIEHWGGDETLEAKVRRVEPAGFTKVSALGVEEQRVNVVLDFVNPSAAWSALGDAYRVEVRIVVWEATDVLKVPTSVLFREGRDWAAYTVKDGRAHRTHVEVGRQTGQEAEVTSGLVESDRVVVHPPDTLTDNARVTERSVRTSR